MEQVRFVRGVVIVVGFDFVVNIVIVSYYVISTASREMRGFTILCNA